MLSVMLLWTSKWSAKVPASEKSTLDFSSVHGILSRGERLRQ